MLARLFPRTADDSWNGLRVAVWLLALLALLKLAMGANVVLDGRAVAINADGIPLDTYPVDAAQAVVALFAIWGVGHFVLALLAIAVVARYRTLVPLMLLVLLVEHVARRLVLMAMPIVRVGEPPGGVVNAAFLVANVVGLGLALCVPRVRGSGSEPGGA